MIPDPAARFGASEAEWSDWRWQLRNALTGAEALGRLVRLTGAERRGLALCEGRARVAVTPYYASLADPAHPSCPVRVQAIPTGPEHERSPGDLRDPLGEDARRPVRALVHRYPDRALLLCWPPWGTDVASRAIQSYRGSTVLYVGDEGFVAGGRRSRNGGRPVLIPV